MNKLQSCPECGSQYFGTDSETQETFCLNCGSFIEVTEIPQQEVEFKADEYHVGKTGITTLLNMSGGKETWSYTINSSDISLRIVKELISKWAYDLALSQDVKIQAIHHYKNLMKRKKTQGRKIDELAATCLLIASRELSPRPLKSIVKVTMIDAKKITRHEKFIVKLFKLKMPIVKSSDFVPFFCGKIERGFETEKRAIEVIEKVGFTVQNPSTCAACAVYLGSILSGNPITLNVAAEKMTISVDILANTSAMMRGKYEAI